MIEFRPPQWTLKPPRAWQVREYAATVKFYSQKTNGLISAVMGSGKSLLIAELCATAKLAPEELIVVSTSTQSLVESLWEDIRSRCKAEDVPVGIWYGRRKKWGQIIVTCMPSMRSLHDAIEGRGRRVKLWIADEAHKSQCATVLEAHGLLKPENQLGVTATAYRSKKDDTITLFEEIIGRYGVDEALSDGVVVRWAINHYDGGVSGDDMDAACLHLARQHNGPGLANATSIEDAERFSAYLSAHDTPAKAIHSKQTPQEQKKILSELEAGRLLCVVHVNLLTEGANYPWLRWLLLRREVASRVRFCQEIGRLLRSHPGKEFAEFDDPHDLFGSFNLGYAEALGEPPPKKEWEQEEMPYQERAERIASAEPPVAMAHIESMVRTLVVGCSAANLIHNRKIIKKADRLKPATGLQIAALPSQIRGVADITPDAWGRILDAIQGRPDCLRFGFASDLMLSLGAIREAKRWPEVDSAGRIAMAESEPYP